MDTFREIATDAITFWERGRVKYNAAQVLVAFLMIILSNAGLPGLGGLSGFRALLILAVISNILYSFVYIIDVFVQLSDYREIWRYRRWLLLWFGIFLAVFLEVPILSEILEVKRTFTPR